MTTIYETGKIIVSHLDNSFALYQILHHFLPYLPIIPQHDSSTGLSTGESVGGYIYIYRRVTEFCIKIMNGLVTAFLTNLDVNRGWISIPKLILLSRMLQQVLHLTKSYFLEEVGVEKPMVKRKKEVENNFSRESDRRTSC